MAPRELRAGRPARTGAIRSGLSNPYRAPRWELPLSTRGYIVSGSCPATKPAPEQIRSGTECCGSVLLCPHQPAATLSRAHSATRAGGVRGTESLSCPGQRRGVRRETAKWPPLPVLKPYPRLRSRSHPGPRSLGREWPGGGRRAARAGPSRLSPSAGSFARASGRCPSPSSCEADIGPAQGARCHRPLQVPKTPVLAE